LISAAIIKYKVKPAWALKEIGLALLVLIIMFVLISYLKSFLTGQHLKLNFRNKRIQE
jgi:hypothetical protein